MPACQACPLGGLIPRCGLVRCPECGFEQPAPQGFAPGKGRGRATGVDGPAPGGPQEDLLPLNQLGEGERARVVRVEARGAALTKLLAMGILPGVEVSLVQAHPLPVIRVGYTTLALDRELAGMVAVTRLAPAAAMSGMGRGRRRGWGRRGRRRA